MAAAASEVRTWICSPEPPPAQRAGAVGWIVEGRSLPTREWGGAVEALDLNRWRDTPEWDGPEGPRRLYDELAGAPGRFDGLLGKTLEYRGFDLGRLSESVWVTFTWPRWLAELAAWDAFAQRHPGATLVLKDADPVRAIVATRCLKARRPQITVESDTRVLPSWPLGPGWIRRVPHRVYRALRLAASLAGCVRGPRLAAPAEAGDRLCAFFPWSTKIAPYIVPVRQEWQRRHPGQAVWAGIDPGPLPELPEPPSWLPVPSALTPGLALRALRDAKKIRQAWRALKSSGCLDGLKDWRGWDLRPLVLPLLDSHVERFFPCILLVLQCESLCRRARLKAVVVPKDNGAAVRSILAGARLAGASSVAIQYGLVTDNLQMGKAVADRLFVHGEVTRRWELERGSAPERVVTAGAAAYDRLAARGEERGELRRELGERLGLDVDRKWVVAATWMTQAVYLPTTKQAELAVLTQALRQVPEAELIFKLHPNDAEGGRLEKQAAARVGIRPVVVSDVTLNEDLILASDVLVSNYSTIVIIAVIAKTPAIILDRGQMAVAPNRPYVDDGVAALADSPGDLAAALREALADRQAWWQRRARARDEFVSEHLYRLDGKASQRICDGMARILGRQQPAS